MDQATKRMVLAALNASVSGRTIELSDRSFWSQFGLPTMAVRREVLERAATLADAANQAVLGGWFGTIGGLFSGTAYPAGDGDGGPVDSGSARVFSRIAFTDDMGNITYKSWAQTFDWGTSLDEIRQAINDAITTMEEQYGIGEGALLEESLIIY